MTLTDRRLARPPLPENAGKNSIRLDLALTRDEIAATVRELARKLNPRRMVDDNPVGTLLLALGALVTIGSVAARALERRTRDV